MKYLKILIDIMKKEEILEKRNNIISDLIKYENCIKYELFGFNFYINEKLGYNSSLINYINIILDKIEKRLSNKFNIDIYIKQFQIDKIDVSIGENPTSISKSLNKLTLNINTDDLPILRDVLNHELHHIFIKSKGHKTNEKYFIVNELVQKTDGKTKAFLMLYYMAFDDELNSNIQMFHSEIGTNKIKNNSMFKEFLNKNPLYMVAIKMKNIDTEKYWNEICKEGYDKLLIDKLSISNIDSFLKKTNDFISNSGNEYIRRMSRTFI